MAKAKKRTLKSKKKSVPARKKMLRKPVRKVVKKTVKKTRSPAKKKVSTIPKGYHSVTPYLIVNNAESAIEFYRKVFGAKLVMLMGKPGEKIGHAELVIGDSKIMLADEFPEMNALAPQAFGGTPVSIHLYVKDVDTVVGRAIAAGAMLMRPVENMFYGDRCGTLEDPYGHKWHVSTHIEDVTPGEMKKRMQALFGQNQ